MTLRKATLLLMLGTLYTVLYKAAHTLLPSVAGLQTVGSVMNVLWLVTTLALVLFAYQFLIELSPRDRLVRYSLISIMIFTLGVVVSKLPIWQATGGVSNQRFLFSLSSFLNALAVLAFLFSFARSVPRESPLWTPLRVTISACCLTAALGIASRGYFVAFLLTGREYEALPFLQPLAMLSFLFTHGAVLWFLIEFRRIDNYAEVVKA